MHSGMSLRSWSKSPPVRLASASRPSSMPKSESSSPGGLLAGVFLDHTELAIDVMADIAALAEFGIGLSGHVGHVGPGSVAGRAGGGGGRSRIHQEVRSLDRVEANRKDGFGAGEM